VNKVDHKTHAGLEVGRSLEYSEDNLKKKDKDFEDIWG